ncbi:hypothetical protein SAMN02745146_0809 [Hymenobacter daecheongensis DSM 21074]|uniref:Uncharacterized protein n=1 Tax=Hymenobacter daecheongensis DSM 21074 TaxID=1121955 RepID=A0A1M6AYL9_9BACT|nr:hypothetical protein [Hymenobacter daecheongensis]SHI41418.1 hypothetical protein SAMN02745146_0809 [Hymenobacter daecheongensis DSM 21074]
MKKTFEDESDALSAQPDQPTTAQPAATTTPGTGTTPIPLAGNGAPAYGQVPLKTQPDQPQDITPGGSATAPESGGGYSG